MGVSKSGFCINFNLCLLTGFIKRSLFVFLRRLFKADLLESERRERASGGRERASGGRERASGGRERASGGRERASERERDDDDDDDDSFIFS